jgi:hypothetical protein
VHTGSNGAQAWPESLNDHIHAILQVKSYLAGNPAIRLALNDDLVIGRQVHCAASGRFENIHPGVIMWAGGSCSEHH